MIKDILPLNSEQIVRLYQVVDTHHQIESAIYMGNDCFKVITDKRRFVAKVSKANVDFVLNGIKLERNVK